MTYKTVMAMLPSSLSSNSRKVCVSLFLDFYFDGASPLIPRVKRHYSAAQYFFDKLLVVTLDNRDFTEVLGGNRITHRPLLPLRVPHFARALLGTLFGIRELVKIARQDRDIIFFSSPYALYSVFVSRILKIPLIVHFKYAPSFQPSNNLKHIVNRGISNAMVTIALRSATVVVVTTPLIKKMVIDKSVPAEKIFVSPNYVDEKLFSLNVDGTSIRRRLSIAKDEKLIIYMGRLSGEKGLDVLMDAFGILCDTMNKAKLLVVGDGVERGKLQERVQELGIQHNVMFLKFTPHSSVPNFLAASDSVVLPSYSEGHPKFLIEAMIMGKPIVATNILGIKDVARNGKEAALVEAGDVHALAETLQLVLENESLALTLGRNARRRALQEYSKEVVFNLAKRDPFLILGF
jgi:glycosyltransferase involved in cell wall biosynthesis